MYSITCSHILVFFHTQKSHMASPLFLASKMGYTEVVDTLLKNGADPNLACMVCGRYY